MSSRDGESVVLSAKRAFLAESGGQGRPDVGAETAEDVEAGGADGEGVAATPDEDELDPTGARPSDEAGAARRTRRLEPHRRGGSRTTTSPARTRAARGCWASGGARRSGSSELASGRQRIVVPSG